MLVSYAWQNSLVIHICVMYIYLTYKINTIEMNNRSQTSTIIKLRTSTANEGYSKWLNGVAFIHLDLVVVSNADTIIAYDRRE